MHDALTVELRSFRARLGAFDAGYVFPMVRGAAHWTKDMLSELLAQVEREAQLPKLEGWALAPLSPEVGDRAEAPASG